MTNTEKRSQYDLYWDRALPHIARPTPIDISDWLGHPEPNVMRAIRRTAWVFRKENIADSFDARIAYRYITAVLQWMAAKSAKS